MMTRISFLSFLSCEIMDGIISQLNRTKKMFIIMILTHHIMTKSKLTSKKVLIPVAIVAVAVGLTIWGLSPAIAAVNQTINSATPGYGQVPKITGSVYAGQPPKN